MASHFAVVSIDCLLNRLFRRRSKETPKLHVNGLCEGNPPATGEFPAQRASNAENVSIWWRQHAMNDYTWNDIPTDLLSNFNSIENLYV